MSETFNEKTILTFKQSGYAMKLRIPDGTAYVEGYKVEDIMAALKAGYAVYGESCSGKIFLWQDKAGQYQLDHFFMGPPKAYSFDDLEEAATFAVMRCD